MCRGVNEQYALVGRDPQVVGDHVVTYMRTAFAVWATPQGERLLSKEKVIEEISSYLRGHEDGTDGGLRAGGTDASGDGDTGRARALTAS